MTVLSKSFIALVLMLPCAAGAPQAVQDPDDRMVRIPAGIYVPILRGKREPESTPVPSFLLAAGAVTNAEYLEFVRENSRWRRSEASRLFADENYLASWQSDLDPGEHAPLGAPVVQVSWFAARAYARWTGLRLPSTAEWELAGQAGFTRADGRNDPEMRRIILAWLATPAPATMPDANSGRVDFNGMHNLHGLIWEWVADFNTAMVTGESRGDTDSERNLFCGAGAAGIKDPSDYPAFMRLAFRSSLHANDCIASLGFRCARSLPSKQP